MHTISVEERNGEYRFVCSCGVTGSWYGTRDLAYSIGLSHKEYADGNPDA